MAIELIARIWRRPRDEVDSSEKFVLTIMADRADDDGLLWYAVDTIADLTSLSARGVQKIMDRLVLKGLVKKLQRRDRSNYYVIQLDRFPHVERVKRPKEQGPKEFVAELDAEPDLFGTGERGAERVNDVRLTGEPGSGTGEPRSPDSLTDSLIDPPIDALAREGGETIDDMVVRLWNELADRFPNLSPFRGKLSDERKAKIEARTREGQKLLDPPGQPPNLVWAAVFEVVASSKLLTGQKIDWAPTLDWVLGPKNYAKITGGNYGHGHDAIGSPSTAAGGRSAVAAGAEARRLVDGARRRGRAHAPGSDGREGHAPGVGRRR